MKTRMIDAISGVPIRKFRNLFLAGALTLSLMAPAFAGATDVKILVKQANKDLRISERQMYSGKNDEAIAGIQTVQEIIESIKQEDPTNKNIQNLEKKVNKIVKSIERKTGRDLGGGSGTLQASEQQAIPDKPMVKTVTQSPSASQPAVQSVSTEKLPYEIRQLIKEARGNVTSAESKGKMLSQPRYAKLTLSQKTKMVDKTASMARKKLKKAKQLAAAEGITDHPDFSELTQRLAAVDALVATDTAKADKQEKEMNSAAATMRIDLESLKVATEAAEKKVGKYVGKMHYNKLEVAETAFIAIEKFEKNDKQAFLQLQKDFGEKYGTTAEEIDGYAKSVGFQNYETPSLAYLGITEFIQEIDQGRVAMAEDLATRSAKMVIGNGRHEFTIREDYQDARNWLSLAAKFSPDNAIVLSEQKTIDSQIDAGLKAFYAKIDARTWPPKSAGGGSSKNQSVAKDYFVQSKDWAKRAKAPYTVLDLMVSGPWSVQKKDLFGSPIMYGLPVIVAVELEKDKIDNLARVFHMTLRTPESASPKAAPPFASDTVGNSYFIRKTAIK